MLATSFPRFKRDTAGIFIYNLSQRLSDKQGIKIEVISPHDYGSESSECWGKIRIHRFPYFYPLRYQRLCYGAGILQNMKSNILATIQLPSFILADILYSLHIIKKGNFDIVHAHWSLPQGLVGILCKMIFKVPCITTIHGSDIYGLKSPLLTWLNSMVIKHSDVCTANSKATAGEAREISGRKDIEIIPMGVGDTFLFEKPLDPEVIKGIRAQLGLDGRVVLFVGRLIDLKGVDYLIKAIPSVLNRCPDTKVLLVGSGPRKDYLMNLSNELCLRNRVMFVDKVSQEELLKFYSIATIFVLPSIVNDKGETEGFGVVLLEAMASRVPVVGTNVGGIPDIISDGKTGLLARQKDPDDLADKITRLLTDDNIRRRVVENGFRYVKENFSCEVVAERFMEIYQEVTLRKSPKLVK